MAVEDKYINADQEAGKLANPAFIQGAPILCLVSIEEIAVADSDLSVYRIGTLPSNAIIIKIEVNNDAITAGTDYDLGLYRVGTGGAVVDADVFADGLDMSSAAANGSEKNGLGNVAIDALTNKLYEHAAETVTDKKEGYDLAWTANTVGSAIGTITTRVYFILG